MSLNHKSSKKKWKDELVTRFMILKKKDPFLPFVLRISHDSECCATFWTIERIFSQQSWIERMCKRNFRSTMRNWDWKEMKGGRGCEWWRWSNVVLGLKVLFVIYGEWKGWKLVLKWEILVLIGLFMSFKLISSFFNLFWWFNDFFKFLSFSFIFFN